MATNSQRQFLAKVDGIPGYFNAFEGGAIGADSTKQWNGGQLQPEILTGPPTPENITLTRGYDSTRDDDTMATLRQQVGTFTATVSKQPTDANLAPSGRPVVYAGARLVKFTEPNFDASSGDPAQWSIEFAVANYR